MRFKHGTVFCCPECSEKTLRYEMSCDMLYCYNADCRYEITGYTYDKCFISCKYNMFSYLKRR